MFKIVPLALAACLAFSGPALAADMKIGIFNSQSIAMQSDAAKAASQKMQGQFGKERTQLEKEARDLQAKGKDLQEKSAAMSAKAREEKQMEFLKLRRDFEEKSRAFAQKVDAAENEVRQGMAQNIFQAAATVAKQQNLDLIIDAASGSVMFAKPEMDITKAVLAEVNRIWKANGNKFPTAPAPAKR